MLSTAMDISTSGLIANRARLDVIAGNLANMSTLKNEQGENQPYQRRFTVLQTDDQIATQHGAMGVKVASVEIDQSQPSFRYEPHHPLADQRGYVAYPKVDMTTEFTNSLIASRAYEANIGVMETTKNLGQQTLRILA